MPFHELLEPEQQRSGTVPVSADCRSYRHFAYRLGRAFTLLPTHWATSAGSVPAHSQVGFTDSRFRFRAGELTACDRGDKEI
ncbi:hypothetical protein ACWD1Y_43725 [Streptomyces sp. NPDC002814]